MTRLLVSLIALAFVAGYLAGKRTVRPCPEPVQDEDRFNMADLPNRVREYDAKFNLERKRGKS